MKYDKETLKWKMNIIRAEINLFYSIWFFSWFAAIWVDVYNLKLFLTGCFSLFIALVCMKVWKDFDYELNNLLRLN